VTRGWWAGAGALGLGALVLFAVFPTYPNYDAYYHLVWGRELLDGVKPTFEAYQAPTPHPLYLALCALLGIAGEHADRLLVLVTLLSLAALVLGVARLGALTFGRWPGVAAAFFTGSSFALLLYAVRAYVDVPFLALVVWAAVVEARAPGRRPALVLILLGLAGLLRPEAWVLAGLYWLWRGLADRDVRRAAVLAVLVVLPPLIWSAMDLWVTGDALHSLTATSQLADELGRERGIGAVPKAFATYLTDLVRAPVALAAAIGIVLAWRLVPRERLLVPAGLFLAGVLTFVAIGVAGLSILPRYLTVPALALCLFAGYAALGFTTPEAPAAWRRAWRGLAIAGLVLGVAFAVWKAPVLQRLTDELRFSDEVHADLVRIVDAPEVRRDLRCGALTFPNYRLVPDARWILDLPRERVGARSAKRREHGVAIFPIELKTLERYGFADGASPSTNVPDPGFVPVARRGRFAAYSAC
jgi:hypothetical protein